eukprot:TRINITY_DN13551_c0_g1_i1.p1 TRINITY_DN13551_c0_g1~~TRINITY_DN13551_c0_g1_i1.p1  ORF type:complete len:326 (+),score=94.45 TRINITY_DN13551_c0_g1_i1:94-1071(+)
MADGGGKAVLCEKFGPIDSLRYRTVSRCPPPKPGHVVISVRACGVNFPDVLMVQGKYQVRPQLPFAAGGEVSGFATEIAMKATAVAPLPPGMPFADAAGFLVTYMTSYYALKSRAQLAPGETVLVLGAAGGCGMAAVQLSKAMGAKVLAIASTAAKRRTCLDVGGADAALEYTPEGTSGSGAASLRTQVQHATGGRGVDIVLDTVGGTVTEESLRCLGRYGRHLVVGFAAGDIPRIPTNLLLLRQASLMGVFMGQWAESCPQQFSALLQELVGMLAQGSIKPLISAVYPLRQVPEALAEVRDRRVQGKVVVTMDEEEASMPRPKL